MSKEYLFAQKVVTNENEVPIEHVRAFTYIECASMDGNKLLLEIMDKTAVYRDDFGIAEGVEVEVTMADINERGNQIWIEKFVVAKAYSVSDVLHVEAFQYDAHTLKTPALQPKFFVDQQPKNILASLLPHLKIECDTFDKGATYHLNAGGTPSRLIRTMARDYGSVAFICRGTVYFKALKNLSMDEEFKLEHQNPNAEHNLHGLTFIGEKSLYQRILNRNYTQWDTVTGMQSSGNGAPVMISTPQAKAINNQHIAIIPVLDVELSGHTEFMPLAVCSVLIHRYASETLLDESLPEKQLINRVAHYQRGDRYQCRLELGVVNV